MKNNKKKASVTEILKNLREPLEYRRAAQRLTLISKSINKLLAILEILIITRPTKRRGVYQVT